MPETIKPILRDFASAAALVLGVHVLAWTSPERVPAPIHAGALILLCAAMALSGRGAFQLDGVLSAARRTWSWLFRLGAVAMMVAIILSGSEVMHPRFSDGGITAPPGLILLVLISPAAVSAVLAILLEAAEYLMRRARRLRTRLVWLALFSAIVSLGLYGFFTFAIRGDAFVVWALQLTLTGWVLVGVAQVLAEPMAKTLEGLSQAVREVSRGNLDVKVPDQGHDELAGLAQALKVMIADLRRYVTPAVLFALRRHQETQVQSERREASILFFDVRGFTALSESVAAEEMMRMIDFLFERMIEVVGAKEGYINRFTGDGMMIVFGAPMDRADHAQAAVDCAVAMQSLMDTLNEASKFGPGRRLEIGIGISSGQVVAGALGSAAREEYTVFGDCVNVANRLCSSAGGGEILISAATAGTCSVAAESLPPLMVKGKSVALEVFRVAA